MHEGKPHVYKKYTILQSTLYSRMANHWIAIYQNTRSRIKLLDRVLNVEIRKDTKVYEVGHNMYLNGASGERIVPGHGEMTTYKTGLLQEQLNGNFMTAAVEMDITAIAVKTWIRFAKANKRNDSHKQSEGYVKQSINTGW